MSLLQNGQNWRELAACIGEWDLFDEDTETGEYLDVELALSICQMCPVRQKCAREGVNEVSGIWGGKIKR